MKRPKMPLQRLLTGAVGEMLQEVRNFLRGVHESAIVWGNEVTVTFTAGSTPVRVETGLEGTPTGYIVVRRSADVRVYDAATPTTETNQTVLWLQSSAAGTVTLRVY